MYRHSIRTKKLVMAFMFFAGVADSANITKAMELEKQTQSDIYNGTDIDSHKEIWTETYTYISDGKESHVFPEKIEKNGEKYILCDATYKVEALTTQLLENSIDLWECEFYEPKEEIIIDNITYELTEVTTEEWIKTERTKLEETSRIYLEGEEIPESIEADIKDDVTGELVYANLMQINVESDGADWSENSLVEWLEYHWENEAWSVDIEGNSYTASEESLWFDGCEHIFTQYFGYDPKFYKIKDVQWADDGWQEADGSWKRTAKLTGDKMIPRYKVTYAAQVSLPDLSMVKYIGHYTSQAERYLIKANVVYEKEEIAEETTDEEVNIFNESKKEWSDFRKESKWQYLLIAALAAVSVGIQLALVLIMVKK